FGLTLVLLLPLRLQHLLLLLLRFLRFLLLLLGGAMTFVSYARWGRCRAAALSPWSRRVNLLLRAHRGLAGAPLLRAAAEHRPLMGFAEQSPVRLVWPDSGRGNGTGRELLHLRRFRPQSLGATRTLYCGASSQK
ncbi:unnamed protein product, partial [Prorocentrum cordatum]